MFVLFTFASDYFFNWFFFRFVLNFILTIITWATGLIKERRLLEKNLAEFIHKETLLISHKPYNWAYLETHALNKLLKIKFLLYSNLWSFEKSITFGCSKLLHKTLQKAHWHKSLIPIKVFYQVLAQILFIVIFILENLFLLFFRFWLCVFWFRLWRNKSNKHIA